MYHVQVSLVKWIFKTWLHQSQDNFEACFLRKSNFIAICKVFDFISRVFMPIDFDYTKSNFSLLMPGVFLLTMCVI